MRLLRSHWTSTIWTFMIVLLNGCTTAPEEKPRVTAQDSVSSQAAPLHMPPLSRSADTEETTPLHVAVQNGDRETVAHLLQQGAVVDQARLDGVTPLALAVKGGHREIVALLLEHGANVHAQARIGGVTLLHVGAYRGDQDIVVLLLKHGADKHARMASGDRPVDLARQQGHPALIPLLEP